MRKFSINQIEQYTGVQKHTIRTWEKRYLLVQPERTNGNLRYYSLDELKILLDVILLYQCGERISKVMALNGEVRQKQISGLFSPIAVDIRTIYQLIVAMYASDIDGFEQILDRHIMQAGIHQTVDHILLPFMERIKLYSHGDRTCEVHFVVTAIRKKLISAIEQLNTPKISGRSALLFLPVHEHFDLILLYMAYLLKKSGVQVWYLGTDISMENLQAVLSIKTPSYLVTFLMPSHKIIVRSYFVYLSNYLKNAQLLLATADEESCSDEIISNEKYFHFSRLLQHICQADH